MWCLPPGPDPAFVAAMEDVLDVYERPHDPSRPVVCGDEAGKQLVIEARDPLPATPGSVAKHDSESVRNGTANPFMFTEPLAGWRQVTVTEKRTRVDFAHAVRRDLVDGRYRYATKVVLVLDNLNTHSVASLYAAFPPAEAKRLADRLEIHHTPKHGSWLNIAECGLSVLGRPCLDRRIPDRPTLAAAEVAAWNLNRNGSGRGVDWRFTTADARVKLKRLYPTPVVDSRVADH